MRDFVNKYFTENNSFRPVLIFFLILGVFQAAFTNIAYDEAYYWRFSQDLDWGYFDHPPMVALMIAIGNSFLPGTLGVRFMTILLSLATYYLLWILIPEESRNKKGSTAIFLLLVLGSPLLNIYSFVTTPDVPLIFFTALYLYWLDVFLKNDHLRNALLLGLVMACLIYSKYHGILVILVTLLAQIKLLKRPYFYLASIFGVILYLPHLWWQYQHDFVSFEYHLSYRSVLFEFKNVVNYVLNSILVLNPLLFSLFLFIYFKKGIGSGIHNRMYNVFIWSFLGFFAFTSFRGHVEPQWIVVVSLPVLVYFHQYVTHFPEISGMFKKLAVASAVLIVALRILIMLPLDLVEEFQKRDAAFYREIDKHANGRPVVFANTYTEASKYSYYTGKPTFSYNFVTFRKNQYDLWDYHRLFNSKDVFFVIFPHLNRFEEISLSNGEHIYTMNVDNLPVLNNLKAEILEYETNIRTGSDLHVKFTVTNPNPDAIILDNPDRPIVWTLFFFHLDKERFKHVVIHENGPSSLQPNSTTTIEGDFTLDLPSGSYTMGIHAWPKDLFEVSLSKRTYPIEITE